MRKQVIAGQIVTTRMEPAVCVKKTEVSAVIRVEIWSNVAGTVFLVSRFLQGDSQHWNEFVSLKEANSAHDFLVAL